MRRIWAIALTSVLELWRRRDIYVALILALAVAVPLASVSVFGVSGVVRYVREVTLLLIWGFSAVIAITTAARQIPSEIQRRTILPLLAKPVRRREVVLGKFLGATLACWAALLLFYACYIVLAGVKSGSWLNVAVVQGVGLHLLFTGLAISMVLCGSMVLTQSANVTLALLVVGGMLLFGARLPVLAERAAFPLNALLWLIHAIAPHFEFFDLRLRMVHDDWGPLPWRVFAAVTAYAVLYAAVFLSAAAMAFQRKRV
jgi:ABC-type transport system involved in multi-copper enzyme maturation permease subunit